MFYEIEVRRLPRKKKKRSIFPPKTLIVSINMSRIRWRTVFDQLSSFPFCEMTLNEHTNGKYWTSISPQVARGPVDKMRQQWIKGRKKAHILFKGFPRMLFDTMNMRELQLGRKSYFQLLDIEMPKKRTLEQRSAERCANQTLSVWMYLVHVRWIVDKQKL